MPPGRRARVVAKIVNQFRDKKIIIQKFKRRKNMRRRNGHRQSQTRVLIITASADRPDLNRLAPLPDDPGTDRSLAPSGRGNGSIWREIQELSYDPFTILRKEGERVSLRFPEATRSRSVRTMSMNASDAPNGHPTPSFPLLQSLSLAESDPSRSLARGATLNFPRPRFSGAANKPISLLPVHSNDELPPLR